MQQDGEALTCT